LQLLHGKDDDDEPEYRYRTGYDRRQPIESTRYYGYPANATSEVRSGFQRPYGDGYRNGYGSEYRSGYVGSEISPRREYRRASLESPRESRRRYGSKRGGSDDEDVIELMVPMCCDKCKEKVEEELSEVEGVESVYCDQDRDRVVVRGNNVDTDRCLVKAERAVKKKCELISNDSDDEFEEVNRRQGYNYDRGESRLYRSNSGGRSRASLGRLPSFASGKVIIYDGVGPRGQDYEEKDYNGFRRMPSFSRHRNHEAEYITSFNERSEPRDSRRDYYNVRRMPSFNRHRHHDAEYISTGDREYSPRTFYEQNPAGSTYTAAYNERPVYRSQVSFSRLPVGNPGYMKHIEY